MEYDPPINNDSDEDIAMPDDMPDEYYQGIRKEGRIRRIVVDKQACIGAMSCTVVPMYQKDMMQQMKKHCFSARSHVPFLQFICTTKMETKSFLRNNLTIFFFSSTIHASTQRPVTHRVFVFYILRYV